MAVSGFYKQSHDDGVSVREYVDFGEPEAVLLARRRRAMNCWGHTWGHNRQCSKCGIGKTEWLYSRWEDQ